MGCRNAQPSHPAECVADLATAQDGVVVVASDEAALATDMTVQPTKTAITIENSAFSKIRPCICVPF